ncbi:MAG TPA: hypothetical protein VHV55_27135 [Pirellulales bacterium]|nr:hypothetical protein [Pirellulales bacterium]
MLLYIGEAKAFDDDALRHALVASGAIQRESGGTGELAAFDYELGEDLTTIRVTRDLETVVIDGSGPASFDIALKLQRGYAEPIHLIDEAYSFDLVLHDYDSMTSLLKAADESSQN